MHPGSSSIQKLVRKEGIELLSCLQCKKSFAYSGSIRAGGVISWALTEHIRAVKNANRNFIFVDLSIGTMERSAL